MYVTSPTDDPSTVMIGELKLLSLLSHDPSINPEEFNLTHDQENVIDPL